MPDPVSTSSGFGVVDWAVVAGYLLATTLIGAKLAGKQSTIRDFFLAGRKLPWWAICSSIIATEISTAIFIVVPAMTYAQGGDFTFLQLAIGTILARIIVGVYFVPRYYEEEIYSPYDYVEKRLGPRVKTITTILFLCGTVLGQGVRTYITAIVLSAVANIDLVPAIWMVIGVGVIWALMGGMSTVIWTDFMQFLVIVAGGVLTLACTLWAIPGNLGDAIHMANDAGKFRVLNLSTDPTIAYTLWCGLLATPFLNLAAFGTDQVMAQRMFCCRNQADARRAIIVSCASLIVTVLMLFVGVGLYVYFQHLPPNAAEQAKLTESKNYVLPLFIMRELHTGIRGVIVAAIFASSMPAAVLAALAQTTLSGVIQPLRARKRAGRKPLKGAGGLKSSNKSDVRISRGLIVGWGLALAAMAMISVGLGKYYANTIDLAMYVVTYTYGPMLGIFLLAFLPGQFRDNGLPWAVFLGVLAVFAGSVHPRATWGGFSSADWAVWGGCGITLALALWRLTPDLTAIGTVVAVVLGIVFFRRFGLGRNLTTGELVFPAFYWLFPVATLVTLLVGAVLGRPIEDNGLTAVVRGAGMRRAGGGAKPSRRQRA